MHTHAFTFPMQKKAQHQEQQRGRLRCPRGARRRGWRGQCGRTPGGWGTRCGGSSGGRALTKVAEPNASPNARVRPRECGQRVRPRGDFVPGVMHHTLGLPVCGGATTSGRLWHCHGQGGVDVDELRQVRGVGGGLLRRRCGRDACVDDSARSLTLSLRGTEEVPHDVTARGGSGMYSRLRSRRDGGEWVS